MRAVLAMIGVSPPAGWEAIQPMQRQADSLSEEWVAAYHRERAQGQRPPDAAAAIAR